MKKKQAKVLTSKRVKTPDVPKNKSKIAKKQTGENTKLNITTTISENVQKKPALKLSINPALNIKKEIKPQKKTKFVDNKDNKDEQKNVDNKEERPKSAIKKNLKTNAVCKRHPTAV